MTLFAWSDEEFGVNVAEIDEQHKQLIAIINELHDSMLEKKSGDIMEGLFERLLRYVAVHFETEERLMETYDYPGFEAHKVQHDELAARVRSMREDQRQGRIVVSLDVMNFLKDWLVRHIKGTDRLYSDFLNSEGVY